jgi:hypothetical protein
LKDTPDTGIKRWNLVPDNVPDQFEVNAEVAMNQPVAGCSHASPVEVWMTGLQVVGKVFDSFANDFKTADKSPLQRFVSKEFTKG